MKKRILRGLSLLLCAALLCVPALAAETEKNPAADRQGPVAVWGTVTRLENGGLLVQNDSEGLSGVVLHGEDIICLDAVSGQEVELDSLKDGDLIYAWVGPAMTLSLPPQATALLILTNIPADYAVPQFYEIVSVASQPMPAIEPPPALTWTEVTAAGGKVLKITDQAELTPYRTKNIVRLEDLVPGTQILVWSDQAGTPTKVLVFPYAYLGYVNCYDDGVVTLNGSTLSQKAKVTESGETLLPVRAVAEALGMQVHWDDEKGAVVSYSEELAPENWTADALLTAVPGGTVYGYEADGTAYEVGGTCVIENGVTYLSQATLLHLLDLYPAV